MGTILAAVTAGVLLGDSPMAPWFPCLFFAIMALGVVATKELLSLLPVADRPGRLSTTIGVLAVLAVNWYPIAVERFPQTLPRATEVWYPVVLVATFAGGSAFAIEMAKFRKPGHSVPRVAYTIFAIGYLGVLPSFLIKLRWLHPELGGLTLSLVFFVPKVGDIAAYFTGRAIGRTPFSPWLSPKKTWEGVVGGLTGSMLTAVCILLISRYQYPTQRDLFGQGIGEAILFGLLVGIAAVLGDLAESLIKRDMLAKDASNSVPGYGGILDVIDSVIFAGPVVYIWFCM